MDVTCETAPHYLTFTDEDLQEDGRFKMNPPLRAREDRDALIEGLLDGTIDMLVTDHAPHSREEKARGLEKSAMGVVGLETSFAASYTALVQTGILPLEKLVDLMHGAPMRRFGCGTELAEGQPADLTAFDLTKTYTVDPVPDHGSGHTVCRVRTDGRVQAHDDRRRTRLEGGNALKEVLFTITENRPLAPQVYALRLCGDTSAITAPGQFLELQLPGFFLRRPLSVCDWDDAGVTILYKVVGKGTDWLAQCRPGQTLGALTGLGNGFDVAACGETTLLIGGGIGVPPMYGLARRLLAAGKTPIAILGFNTAQERFYEEEFRALGVQTVVTTADGSYGVRGFVTDALPEVYDTFCACGPLPMLRALCRAADKPGFLSLEARMGCGFGACMGCTIETLNGPKRVCREGPVFRKEELLW